MASIILSMTGSLLRWHNASMTGKLFESAPEPDQRANILDYLETRLFGDRTTKSRHNGLMPNFHL